MELRSTTNPKDMKEIEHIIENRKITKEEVREQKIAMAMAESLSGERTLSREFVTPIIDGDYGAIKT